MNHLNIKTPDAIAGGSDDAINREWRIGRLQVRFCLVPKANPAGRLGGGWAWGLGVLGAPSELCMKLFICTLRFRWMPEPQRKMAGSREKTPAPDTAQGDFRHEPGLAKCTTKGKETQ